MKKLQYVLMSFAGIAISAACTLNQLEEPQLVQKGNEKGQEVTFTAIAAQSEAGTKTSASEDGLNIFWNPGDKIMVSFKGSGSEFVYNGEGPVQIATFQGWIGGFTGSFESQSGATTFWAVYPFSRYVAPLGDGTETVGVVAVVPSSQEAKAGTFDPNALVTVARSNDLSLAFYNVCGGVKFSLTQEGIQQVEFRSNDGTPLAGRVGVFMDGAGCPIVANEVQNPESTIVLTAPYGETFEVGSWYYLVCLPGELEQGFTMTFRSETKTGELVKSSPVTVKRSVWGRLEDADADVTYVDEENIIGNEIRYTTTDGSIISPNNSYMFTEDYTNIVSNTYENGVGRIRFNSRVVRIPNNAFSYRDKLETVVLPKTVKEIESTAFYGNSVLKEVRVAEGVEIIGDRAFYANPELERVFIPSTVRSVGRSVFVNCPKLASFGDALSADGRCLIIDEMLMAFAPAGLTAYTIPDGVTVIAQDAFVNTVELQSVLIPAGVEMIGESAFSGSSIQSVTLPVGLTTISAGAFAATGLTSLTVPDGVTTISDSAFQNCLALRTVSLPGTLTDLGYGVFSGDTALESFEGQFATDDGRMLVQDGVIKAIAPAGLTELTIPGEIKVIGASVFEGLSNLKKIVLEDGVEAIESNAFVNCSALEEIEIPGTVTSWGSNLFFGTSNLKKFSGPYASSDGRCLVVSGRLVRIAPVDLTEFVIPDEVTIIDARAFEGCSQLVSVTLKEGVTEIGNYAFAGCSALTGMTVPSTVTRIGNYAFSSCSSLSAVTLNEGLQEIGDWAFLSCGSLTEVIMPSTLSSIGDYAFFVNSKLTSLTLNEGLTTIGNNAFAWCTSLTELTIPTTLTSMGTYAFMGCQSLASLTVKAGAQEIGPYSFAQCTALTEASIAAKRIGNNAFAWSTNLASLTLEEGVQVINDSAFSGCAVTEVTIPSTVTTLGIAFNTCRSLSSVTLKCTSLPTVNGDWPFHNGSNVNSIQFYVPATLLDAYRNTWPWTNYGADQFHSIP